MSNDQLSEAAAVRLAVLRQLERWSACCGVNHHERRGAVCILGRAGGRRYRVGGGAMRKPPTLTPRQWVALHTWIFCGGERKRRHWKSCLASAWRCAGEGWPHYSPELQQLRNTHGPTLLANLTEAVIVRESLPHRTALALGKGL